MKLRFPQGTVFRVFVRTGCGVSPDKQIAAAKAVVPPGYRLEETRDLDMWRTMTRGENDGAATPDVPLVYKLEIVPPARSAECPSPSAELGRVLGSFEARGIRLMETFDGGSHPNKTRLLQAQRNIKHGSRKVWRRDRLSAGGKKRGEQVSRDSTVNWWRHPDQAKLRQKYRNVWCNRDYPNYAAALEAVNAALEDTGLRPFRSWYTCYESLGPRGPEAKKD